MARADALATAEGKRVTKGEFKFAGEKSAGGDHESRLWSFFSSLKTERTGRKTYRTRDEASKWLVS
jgi:hypothetical protein